ncbi:cupin domain-containing protein [Gemmatimonas phototrophica]|nr:cupin domain-containing protein [Gemmatimonas phototrophica]
MTPTDHAVFHLCSRAAANGALASGEYRADSLGQEGFIHLSRAHQVRPTAHAYFAGVPDVVVLVIDPTLLTAPLVYEPPAPLPSDAPKADAPGELYPHCYGPIKAAAIVDVMELDHVSGQPVSAATMALLRQYRFLRLPLEGTLYRETWRTADTLASGSPVGTAMIGLFADSLGSVSRFHRLTHDEVWHAYAGDPFVLYLLHNDGSTSEVLMGTDPLAGQAVQCVVPAGTWQAGALQPGGDYALYGCTMAPGFSPGCFEAGPVHELTSRYPSATEIIARLGVTSGETRMPELPGH